MPYDDEQRTSESRKLEALTAISVAIGTLGKSLAVMVEQSVDHGRKLESMDRKLDRLLRLAETGADAAVLEGS